MRPLNLIPSWTTFPALLAAMLVLHSLVHSAPCNRLGSGRTYIALRLDKFIKQPLLDPNAPDKHLELTDTEARMISMIYLHWMKSFKRRLSAIMSHEPHQQQQQHETETETETEERPLKIWDFERFVAYWQELKKIQLRNEASSPLIREFKQFMVDPKTLDQVELASRIRDSHIKLVRLLNEIEPMMQKDNREPYEKIRPLLVEARNALEDVERIHWLIDPAPSKLEEILSKFPELETMNKFITGESSWATQSLSTRMPQHPLEVVSELPSSSGRRL